jgi:hypothetical protein
MPWRPSYLFSGSAAYDDDPAYLRRWGPYLDHITECGYEDSLVEAKEERRRALRGSTRGPALLRLRLHTGTFRCRRADEPRPGCPGSVSPVA